MPLDLTDLELETAARACRALAYQEGEAAKKLAGRSMREPVENAAKRAAARAEKLEAEKKSTGAEFSSGRELIKRANGCFAPILLKNSKMAVDTFPGA